MVETLKISAVSYLNSIPFIHGIEHSGFLENYTLELDHPAQCAQRLINGSVDVGLVPVAILPKLSFSNIITSFCIGCDGPVKSVALFSEVPLNKIKRIYLDYQSKTSVQLIKILAREYWRIEPEWLDASEGYETNIQGETAGLVIGDRAFELLNKKPFVYDLGAEWKTFTGTPFVFACWVANKVIPQSMIEGLEKATRFGIENLEIIAQKTRVPENLNMDLKDYLTTNISYELTEAKKKGLETFLNFLNLEVSESY